MSLRVLIADDSASLRRLLADSISEVQGVEVVAMAADGFEAVALADAEQPAVVVLDIHMPRMNGLDALRAIRHRNPETEVIMLTNHADPVYKSTCLKAGASLFFDKTREFEQVGDALREIAERRSPSADA